MAFNTKASDWEVLGFCQVGGAAVLGAAVWFFNFRSKTANVDEIFNLSAGLGGVGGSIGGSTLPDLAGNLVYTPVTCAQPFSLYDLNGAAGMVGNAGVSFAVGYSAILIAASKLAVGGALFHQEAHGFSAGVGASVVWGFGVWTHMK